MNTFLKAEKISYERYYRSVFGTVSVTQNSGDCLLLTGINGAGKTTLLKVLAGILKPTQGQVETTERHFIGHQPGLHNDLTVLENLLFYRRLWVPGVRRQEHEQAIHSALQALDAELLSAKRVGSLSAGQAKRAALARLFLQPQPLWLLDEPFVNLDQNGIDLLLQHIRSHCQQGGAAVIASHALGLADLPRSQRLRLPIVRSRVAETET